VSTATVLQESRVPAETLGEHVGWRINGALTDAGAHCWDQVRDVLAVRDDTVIVSTVTDAGVRASVALARWTVKHDVDPDTGQRQPARRVPNLVHVSRIVPAGGA